MNYNEAIDYIHSFLKFGSKPGLERVSALLEKTNNPQDFLRIIHIAGTNGKGTTSTMVSNVLIENAHKTALFTSPYVIDFCERMQIDSKMISHDELVNYVEKYKDLINDLNSKGVYPTEFELITAMAFDYFKENNCEYAVTEVGLGGLYDSTNVVKSPEVTSIVHIDFDHQDVLGNTLREIALQKCGIIKENVPCVVYPDQYGEVFEIIEAECKKKNSRMIVPDMSKLQIIKSDIFSSTVNYKGNIFSVNLPGCHQVLNAITAFEIAKVLQIDEEKIVKGIEKTFVPARIEVISKEPLVILDGAHNPDGAKALCDAISKISEYTAVVSMMKDKDVDTALSYLLKNAENVVVTKCSNPRAMKVDELKEKAQKFVKNVYCDEDVNRAFDKAMEISNKNAVVVCGSLYLAGDIRKHIKKFFE